MSPRLACLALLAASLVFIAAPAPAQSPTPQSAENARIQQLLAQRDKVQHFQRVALSWNGQQLAWIVSKDGRRQLELASWRGHDAHAVKLAGGCQPEDLAWRRHAMTLAVLTLCEVDPSNTQPIKSSIQLIDTDSSHPAQVLAHLNGFAQGLRWSPDGKRLGFLIVPGATRLPFATASGNPRVGVIGVQHIQVQRVASINTDGGKPEMLTPKGLYAYAFSWAPEGARIVYTAAPPPGDDNWWTAKLYVQRAQTGGTPRMIVDPTTAKGSLQHLQIALPRWSRNGNIFFIGGLMSDRGATGGDIYRVPAKGGTPVDLTEGAKVSPSWFTFYHHGLLVSQFARGKMQLVHDRFSGAASLRQSGLAFTLPASIGDGREVSAVSLSGDQKRIAYIQNSFTEAPEVHAGVLGSQPPPAVTSLNAGLAQTWGKAKSVEWNNGDVHVQGWLVYPANTTLTSTIR